MAQSRASELADLPRMLEESVDDGPPIDIDDDFDGDFDSSSVISLGSAASTSGAMHEWILRDRSEWQRLARYRLPWTADHVAEALAIVLRFRYVEAHRVRPVLKGAGQVCADGRATVAVLELLHALLGKLVAVEEEQWEAEDLVPVVRRVLASAPPPDLLDLGLLQDGDGWAEGARTAAREVALEEAAPLVRQLGQLGRRKPTASWSRATAEALRGGGAQQVLRRWLEIAAWVDPVPEWPGSRIGACCGVLFVGRNGDLVRAAVWATSLLPDSDWATALLGVLARRGSAHNGMEGMPEALALSVATAAVEALAARGADADRAELAGLAEDLQRSDLLRRVGSALGAESKVAERIEQVRTEKARTQRRKAAVGPRKERAAMDSFLRAELGPTLRRLGFRGGPRTWRREHPDRVDLVVLQPPSDWRGNSRLRVVYGTWFDSAHPPDEPYPMSREGLREWLLDIRISDADDGLEADPLSEAAVLRLLRELELAVVPLLDSLEDLDVLRDVAENRPGALAAGHYPIPGALAGDQVLGQLALSRRDRSLAVHHLTKVVERMRQWDDVGDQGGVVDYWSARLSAARALPDSPTSPGTLAP